MKKKDTKSPEQRPRIKRVAMPAISLEKKDVLALREGLLTLLRVPMVPQPPLGTVKVLPVNDTCEWFYYAIEDVLAREITGGFLESYKPHSEIPESFTTPYGKKGFVIKVKEDYREIRGKPIYKADKEPLFNEWSKAFMMPDEFVRYGMEVVNIAGERLQAIKAKDVVNVLGFSKSDLAYPDEPHKDYQLHWDHQFAGSANAYDKNPWVWSVRVRLKEMDDAVA